MSQREGLCSVQVEHQGEDAVGRRFALALKERIKKSALFRLGESRKDAMFGVHFVSIDLAVASEPKGDWSAIALTFVAVGASSFDSFLTMAVRTVGERMRGRKRG